MQHQTQTTQPTESRFPVPLAVKPPAAARLLGISRSQLYELMAAGELPSFYAGKRLRLIAMSDIEAFITAARKRAA